MRFLLAAVAVVLGACSMSSPKPPASAPHQAAGAADLRAMTVGLVEVGEGNETRVFCTAVWVGPHTLLTANHCVEEAEIGDVVFYETDADVFDHGITQAKHPIPLGAHLLKRDAEHDIATLLTPQLTEHPFARLRVAPVEQGMPVQAMGHSIGLWYSYSTGVVAAMRELDLDGSGNMVWLQATAPISPGNSGGGLFDSGGALVGVCSRGFRRGQNLNLWVPTVYVQALLQ